TCLRPSLPSRRWARRRRGCISWQAPKSVSIDNGAVVTCTGEIDVLTSATLTFGHSGAYESLDIDSGGVLDLGSSATVHADTVTIDGSGSTLELGKNSTDYLSATITADLVLTDSSVFVARINASNTNCTKLTVSNSGAASVSGDNTATLDEVTNGTLS